nr:Pyridine nucleotide-disulfide oxidoreductase [uncultured bacterium]
MGYFFGNASRSYVILEKTDMVGAFFEKYPRMRRLISINKRYTGRRHPDFNLRHDWNSLLSHKPDLLFTKYTEKYYPHADDYLRYLDDYANTFDLNIHYRTTVTSIGRPANSSSSSDRCQSR